MIQATVVIDLGPLERFKSALQNDLRKTSNGPIRQAFKQWAARYKAFLRERFSRLSRGGGEWPAHALRTLQARANRGKLGKGKKVQKAVKAFLDLRSIEFDVLIKHRKFPSKAHKAEAVRGFNEITRQDLKSSYSAVASILIDTGTLFAALDPGPTSKPGGITEDIPFGVAVGFGGGGQHPHGGATIADIAMFHQLGSPEHHLPQRTIVVPPDTQVMAAMAGDMERALVKMLGDSGSNK